MKFSDFTYERPKIETVENRFNNLLEQFENAKSVFEQEELIRAMNEIRSDFNSMFNIASIKHSINTDDKRFEEEQTFFDVNNPKYQALITRYYRALVNSEFNNELREKLGDQLFDIAKLSISTFKPEIIKDLQRENELSSEYLKLMASAKIMFEGKEYNMKGLDPFCMSTDREVRKKANEAKWSFMSDNQETFDRIFDDLVKVRHKIAQKLGFENFVELGYARMLRTDYNEEQVATFRNLILEYVVPIAQSLRERQAKRIGLDQLKYYDVPLYFENGNPMPKGDPEWILDNGRKMYDEMSPETSAFFDFMMSNELMDVLNRKGKATGGYCTYIDNYKAPFIFSNFNGTSADIDVLTHEAGHAFQVFSSRDIEIPEYLWPTYEACEIHSMSMEFFAWPWMHHFFEEDTDKYKFGHISSSLLFLPYGVSVDEFQHWVYKNPDCTPAERRQEWMRIEKKYAPETNFDGNEYLNSGGYWHRQLHIFQMPFYYIDYTLAQICAFQFWKKSMTNSEEAFDDYVNLCKEGGKRSFLKLIEFANLKSPFDEEAFKEVIGSIKEYLDQTNDANWA